MRTVRITWSTNNEHNCRFGEYQVKCWARRSENLPQEFCRGIECSDLGLCREHYIEIIGREPDAAEAA